MIFVTVGTHHQPFDRLIAAVGRLGTDSEVVIQRGPSLVDASSCVVHDFLPWSEQHALLQRADVVICHAAPATIFECWQAGLQPIVVPRDPRWGEHVDDHQLRFARRLGDGARVVLDVEQLPALIRHPDVLRRGPRGDGVIASAFVEAVSEAAVATAHSRRRRRLRVLQGVKKWMVR